MQLTFNAIISAIVAILVVSPSSQALAESPLDPSTKLQLVHDDFELADGAAWDGHRRLFVPDVKAEQLLAFNLREPKIAPGLRVKGMRISGCCYQLGQLYLSDNGNSRLAVVGNSGPPKMIAQFDPKNRPNDLVVDAHGNTYITFTREGTVGRVAADEDKAITLAKDLVAPNGIGLSPDGSTLYVSSFKEGTIYKINIANHQPKSTATVLATLPKTDDGFRGDGMCVDRAGNLYCTGAKDVTVLSPAGKVLGKITPPHRPINAVIGGVEGRTLYISTFGGLYQQKLNTYAISPTPADPADAITDGIQSSLNRVYMTDGDRKLLMDVFTPTSPSSAPRPAIVVVHGGGWLKGDKTKFRELAMRLAGKGYVTAAIEYRLGFESKFPSGIRDCNAATRYLRANANELGIDPNRIAAVGGSAGGHLVGLMAAGSKNPKLQHDSAANTSSALKAAVVMAGPLEIATGTVAEKSHDSDKPSNAVNWLGGTISERPELYQLADAYEQVDASTPPICFLAGSKDNPERNDKTRAKLKQLGIATDIIVHQDAKHGHWNRPEWMPQVVDDIDRFFRQHL